MKKIILYIIIIAAFISGCEERADWDFKNSYDDLLVVDGLITNEKKEHIVRLSRPVTMMNGTPFAVTDAIVKISDSDTNWALNENPYGSGIYKTDTSFRANASKEYELKIIYEEKFYNAKTYMIGVTPFKPVAFEAVVEDSLYRIVNTNDIYNPNQAAMFEVWADWTHLPQYADVDSMECRARIWFYTLTTLDVSQIFSPAREELLIPRGAIVKHTKYSLTPEHEKFIRSLISEAEWRGGYFDAMPANLTTNLSEGAIGFFGACTVSSYDLVVE